MCSRSGFVLAMEKSEILDDTVKGMQEVCTLSSPGNSPKKHSKRKCQDISIRGETPKKPKTAELGMNSSNCELSDDTLKPHMKKNKGSRSRKNNPLDPAELKNVLEGMDEEIDDILEETAQKNQLTATNVKNILRHVITNEYVLAMVRNTMKTDKNESDDLEEAMFEPKLTRSKVKELREKQRMLPWPISTPIKQSEPASRALLEEEFSDGSSSDEDYKPNEEECHSEEDNITLSPKSADLDSSICDKTSSPIKNIPEEDGDEDALVIALPESELDPATGDTEIDKIALRTRSKLPLNDTPLEAIEASFIAPDITVDMYDTHCDDEEWQGFLRELSKPIDAIVAVEKPDEEPDDAEDDPEYNVLDDDDIPDELDLRFDNTVKITRKELNALMAEIMESAQMELNDCDEEDEDFDTSARPETPSFIEGNSELVENTRTEWMTYEERLQLDQQMRMYVQLLTQSYLISFGDPDVKYINISNKLFLDEIKMFASRGVSVNEVSAFNAYNLDGALSIINLYESGKINVMPTLKSKKIMTPIKSLHIKKTLFNSNVFIYPELLPVCSYHKSFECKKAKFTAAEDNLIALGLEEFSFSDAPLYYIKSLLLPTKTENQIKLRIKNSKCEKTPLDNPIKFYFKHKHAPPFPRIVRAFNPNDVKAPKDYHPDCLPNWMRIMSDPASVATTTRILPLLPKTFTPSSSRNKNLKLKIDLTPTPPKSYRKLLPRNSPLKQISPILKKYNQKRHILPNDNNTLRTRKSVRFAKRLVAKSPTPKPDSSSENTCEGNILNNALQLKDNNIVSCSRNNSTEILTSGSVVVITEAQTSVNSSNTELINHQTATSECTSDIGVSQCDVSVENEVLDGEDEENVDDEPECTAQQDPTVTSSTNSKKPQPMSKKKNRQQRDLESSLALLQPNLLENDPKKEEREALFANSYLLRVTETLKTDPDTCEKFLKALCRYQHCAKSPTKLYYEIKEILKDYPALVDDFVAFLHPEQAKDCGKYIEYVTLSKIRQFVRKVEVHFRSQPQHLFKILKIFSQFKQQSGITSAEVLASLQPLLKNQSHLIEELTNILPDIAPPEHLMTDFEDITIPNSEDDNSSIDSCEEITIPDVPDPYGGKDCPCDCHISSTETKVVNRVRHCVKCGIKFMDGKIYIQTGKVLKPAQVIYNEVPPEPVKISSNEPKVSSKNKQSSACSKNTASEQHSKLEIPHPKKDHLKTQPTIQQSPEPTEDVPSTSKLPCDIIEDTVFPTIPKCLNKKTVPPDFSHLSDVISQTKDKDNNLNNTSTGAANSSEQSGQSSSNVNQKVKWSREEDKLIIYNCQRFGVTDRSFQTSASILKTRSPIEVQERFIHIMTLLSKEIKL